MSARDRRTRRVLTWLTLGLLAIIAVVAVEVRLTRPVREAVRVYTDLIEAANRGDVRAAEALCTDRYVRCHGLRRTEEGGVVGLPRNINKNFQAWQEGGEVWLCPSNRVGPVFRFVPSSGAWKFDGKVGLLLPGGKVEAMEDEDEERP